MHDFSTVEGTITYVNHVTEVEEVANIAMMPALIIAFFITLVYGVAPIIEWILQKLLDLVDRL